MAADEMFDSAVRSAGDKAGVFEYDGDTGYFYLYETGNPRDRKVVGAIRVLVGKPDFSKTQIAIRWDAAETKVGLFIRAQLWAAFDSETRERYGGDYCMSVLPKIPLEITEAFHL